ncbi:MAG: flagellar motor protein MotA [Alphaproteobacteria bacterium]|nr:flagellar motor protein MotA [Alphaproteobacteria bacterium]
MARSLERSVKFVRPGRYILNMLMFILAVGAVVYYLSPLSPQPTSLLLDAFNANPALNGLILGVLAIGIIYNLRQAGVIAPAVRWVESFRESVDPARARMPRPPTLISAMSKLLLDADTRSSRLSPESSRAILDSIGTRMDEGRELGRYLMNLLVFLGLLGTFWGLLETVNAVANTINGLATVGVAAEDAVAQLITNLREPLSGMGTAFSSSLFGLGGSLVVGFLDLQAGQAQNRFYTDLEDWLAGMTETVRTSSRDGSKLTEEDGDLAGAIYNLEAALAANTETQIKALAGQNAELKDEIRALNRTLIRFGGGK